MSFGVFVELWSKWWFQVDRLLFVSPVDVLEQYVLMDPCVMVHSVSLGVHSNSNPTLIPNSKKVLKFSKKKSNLTNSVQGI